MLCNALHIYIVIALTTLSYSLEMRDHTKQSDDTIIDTKKSHLCDYIGGPKALGMETGDISDNDISASSAYNLQSVGPQSARLNKEISGGAWCPSKQLSSEHSGNEWIQVNLGERYVITTVATQGRFGNGEGVEFAEEFYLEYSRDNGSTWNKWTDINGNHLLEGNVDSYSVVRHHLEIPIVGINRIRLYPYAKHLRTVCLRFELYGCLYEGPISYSIPNGIRVTRFGNLADTTYDGLISSSNHLSAGLGQLVDGIKGHENYKTSKKYGWIGWQNTNQSVDVVFDFGNVHKFTTTAINCHNVFTREVRVFSSVLIWFSIDGIKWSNVPIKYTYQFDNILERPRDVIIHLQYRIGRFVKMSLRFGAKWLHISEITFDSQSLVNTSANISQLFELNDNFGAFSDLNEKIALTPKTSQDTDQIKFSLIIIMLITLGVVVLMLLTFFIRAYNNRKATLVRQIFNTEINNAARDNQNVNMKDIPKITTPQTMLYCEPKYYEPKDMSPTLEDNEYATVADVIFPNEKPKTPQMSSLMSIKTNPRYYASSEIIKGNHNLNYYNNKYDKQVLNQCYKSANSSPQQSPPPPPPLLSFMANQSQQYHQRNNTLDSPQLKRYDENDKYVFDRIGNSKFGDVLFTEILAKAQPQQQTHQQNRDTLIEALNSRSAKTRVYRRNENFESII